MTIRLYCGYCRAKRQHRGNGVGMMICVECRRYRDLPEGKGATEVYHMEMSEATDTTKDKCTLVQVPQEYIKALAFYADPANWKSPSEGFALQYDREPSPVEKDKGRRARRLVNVRKGSNE